MINLIPMAGEGIRFKNEGYKEPKPLIKVSGKPMIIQACSFLPKADKWIFACRKEHIDNYTIDKTLKSFSDNVDIISIDKLTEGQACTCLLAKEAINNDEELLIAACDNGMLWDKNKFEELKKGADCLVWTFRNNTTVKEKPEAYGWVKIDDDGNAEKVSVKVPISDTPMNDHAVIATFWFKHGSIFVEASENMIKKNRRINNEFYVDECINEVIESGYKVKVFEVEKYICWGTPNDLNTFNYWQNFFDRANFHCYSIKEDVYYGK